MKRNSGGRRWRLWTKLALTATFVAVLYSRLDLKAVAQSLAEMPRAAWFGALVLYLLAQWISGYRWLLLTRPLGIAGTFGDYTRLYFEGMFISLCLPTSIGGDVYKAYRLGPDNSQRVIAALSVFGDRVIGLVALVVVGLCGLVYDRLPAPAWLMLPLAGIMAATVVGGARLVIGAAVPLARRTKSARIADLAARLQAYRDQPRLLHHAMLLSLVVQLLNVVVVIWLARAIGISLAAGPYFVAVPAVILLTVLPISIGGAGVREGALALALAGRGLPAEQGVSLGIAWFAVLLAAGLVGGVVYVFDRGKRAAVANPAESSAPVVPSVCTVSAPREEPNMSVSVVIPVYNEEPNLGPLYRQLSAVLSRLGEPYEMVFVDDGSTDGSCEVLRSLAAQDAAVKVVYFRRNYGQTAAMNAGLHMAEGDVIVTLDADLQNDPADIPMMLAKLREGYDLVHGWRSNRQDKLLSRRIPSKLANWLISRVTRFPVHDLGCTLKVIRREIAQELELYGEMHRFIPILASWRGARCAEVITQHHPRRAGQSKYGLSRTLRVLLDLITVKYMIQYFTSPMKLFGMVGLAALAVGGAAGTATTAMKLGYGVDMTGNPLLLLAAFSALAGLQFIMLGMLGELGARTYYESQNKRPYAIRETLNLVEPRNHDRGSFKQRAA